MVLLVMKYSTNMKKKETYKLDFAVRVPDINVKASDFSQIMERGIEILTKKSFLKSKMLGGVIHLVITTDADISYLNAIYRGKAEPTDVISLSYFDEPDFPGGENLIGEIMISADTAIRQARENRTTLKEELRYLFAHGLLHLFGFDHKTAAEKKAMFELQEKVLFE